MPTEQTAASPDAGVSQPENSQFTAPKIELPKGGGAIRGIGEKFETNAANGTGTLTIPLGFSAGRSGFTPSLSLAYDSGSGNGPFGIGWSLSLPSITRKTDKGLPHYRSIEIAECDVFILSGAEDLVPVLVEREPGLWVNDEFQAEGHRVKRYRPRIEGLFARIERWTRLEDGDEHWRSISKENTLTVYGRDANSRIFDPEDPSRVFSWLIAESYDDKGNAIVYEYAAEDDRGVDRTLANEARRVRTANRYLKRIKYGNRRPLLIDPDVPDFRRSHIKPVDLACAGWMFETVFDYGDEPYSQEESDGRCWARYAPADGAARTWPVRVDPFSKYRSRFEVRTYRLCHRVLMLHHFPEELGLADYLVRATEFAYRQKTIGSFIVSCTQAGYVYRGDGRYLRQSMPPLEVEYSQSPLDDGRYREYKISQVDHSSLENLPAGIDEKSYRWIDLNGEGISGILSEQGSSWFYKSNRGNGRFGPTRAVARKPSIGEINRGAQQLLDVAGDGTLNLVQFDAAAPGFYTRTNEGAWGPFHSFRALPVIDWKDPNLHFVDVTGDGIADILITEDDAMLWHPSLLDEGFGPEIRVAVSADERQGPHVIFADGIQSVYLADMSGDGLSDLVRVRNGEVCYWPNRGYGVFGPKVVMDNAPWFADEDIFEQSRVRLADTDGSGCTDIVYLGADAIRIYLNQSGNSWSGARILKQFAPVNSDVSVSVVDLLGRGTACLLWSSSLPADYGKPLCYIDLMEGQKPHLLIHTRNNLGAETRIEYASSTEFYLADKAAGKPWVTRLPFPVHVVKRVETYDFIGRNRFVTSYTYHHGFFDGFEREFRGFGMVEQLDTQEMDSLGQGRWFPSADNEDRASSVPPGLTKTWYHTGVFLGSGRISRHLAHEYYREPAPPHAPGERDPQAAMLLDDTILPDSLTGEDARDACRALKGATLRQEIYALDGTSASARPYLVTESNMTIRVLQPRGNNLHCVFFTYQREDVTFHYERKLYAIDGEDRPDPRVGHKVTLAADDFGNVLESVAIGYGRRYADPSPLLNDSDRGNQKQLLMTLTARRFTNPVEHLHAYRIPAPAQSRVYQLVHLGPRSREPGITNLFRFDELQRQVRCASDGLHDLPFEDFDAAGATAPGPYRRLYDENRNYYRADRLDRILPLGVAEALALPGRDFRLAFSPDLLAEVYHREPPHGDLIPNREHVLGRQCGYIDLDHDGNWWEPTGRIYFSARECDARTELEYACRHFFLPRRYLDPFNYATVCTYDPHELLPNEVRDPVNNILRGEADYRILALYRLTDANRNRSETRFDALGRVAGSAVMGKLGQRAGDSLDGFEPDLDEATVIEHMSHPLRDPHRILGLATSRFVYDPFAYIRSRDEAHPQPPAVYTLARETHAADIRPGERTKVQHSFSYSDGFSRAIQHKVQAEPGPLADGQQASPRWIGSGWTIYNNKGKPVRKYEPFFSATHTFEFARTAGVSSILFYDPVDRVVATLHPNHSFEKVVFDPWTQTNWDVNDTVLEADPARDPDVGEFFSRLPHSDYLPTWYALRAEGAQGKDEQQAALQTAVHGNTPSYSFADTLGRAVLTVAHNRFERDGALVDQFIATRMVLDVAGNQMALIDALGRTALRSRYDMRSKPLRQLAIDSGTRWVLNNVVDRQLLSWNSRGYRLYQEYDELHRPTKLFVRNPDGNEFLAERLLYGEGLPNDLVHNLRGKCFRQFDGAGALTNEQYDFKGNLLRNSFRLLVDYRKDADWRADNELEEQSFATAKTFDALNRITTMTTPDESVALPRYNQTSLLESLTVRLRGSAESTEFVSFINYDAQGRRTVIDYGNGARTHYSYDPLTFRLIHLLTHRSSDQVRLQDLHYTFDPIGNVVAIRDHAQETVFFRNQVVSANNGYTYDALYRLVAASGREHAGLPGEPEVTFDDMPRMNHPLPSDGHALHLYRESYDYDDVGNILRLLHRAPDGNWKRTYCYGESSSGESKAHPENNRLRITIAGQRTDRYSHDDDGNMTRMPHLAAMEWSFKDQLRATRRQAVTNGRGEITFYIYNSAGDRVRKVTERASGSRIHERVYLGNFELYRRYSSVGIVKMERETLRVTDDKRLIALVEYKTVCEERLVESPTLLARYQFDNHLGSIALELDHHASIITYEEYYPYGSTSFEAGERAAEVSRKRYRYIGKERDEETELYSMGARYYASWLGRWTSCDPKGTVDGPNLYLYSSNNPIRLVDPTGTDGKDTTDSGIIKAADWHAIFQSKEWKAAIKKAKNYRPKLMTREEHRAWLEKREAQEAADKAKDQKPAPTPAPTTTPAPEPNVDPPQAFSPPGANYQSAPGQPLGGFSLGGFWQNLHLSNYGSQYTLAGGLVPAGGDWGAEIQVQGVHNVDPSGNSSGSVFAGPHVWYGANNSRNNFSGYALVGNGVGQNPNGKTGDFGATGIFAYERLIGGNDRDHPLLTLGGNVTGSYLQYLSIGPPGQPAATSTNVSDAATVGGTGNATLSFLYAGKTPRLQLWGEGYGSHTWSSTETGQQPGSVSVGGGGAGVVSNTSFGTNGWNIFTIGLFVGGRYENDKIGNIDYQSSQLYWGGGVGFARRFW